MKYSIEGREGRRTESKLLKRATLRLRIEQEHADSFDADPADVDSEVFPGYCLKGDGVDISVCCH